MRAVIIGTWAIVAAVLLVGCQSTQNSWHMENSVVKNTRVERFPAMFTAPYTKAYHQECPLSARVDATMYQGYDKLKFAECVTMKTEVNGKENDHWDQAFEPGTLNGMGGSVLQAGSILGGAALIRPSRVTQHNQTDIRASTVNPAPPVVKK